MCMGSLDLAGHASLKHLSLRNVYPMNGLAAPAKLPPGSARRGVHLSAGAAEAALETFLMAL